MRANISGTAESPRLDVFRSANHIYAQVIDDANGVTLVSASSTEKDFGSYGGNKEAARKVGQIVAATSTTAASKNSQRAPARADSSFNGR